MIKQFIPWIIGILYFLLPYDAIPDFFVGPGWLDDLAVLGLAYWWYHRMRRARGTGTTYYRTGSTGSTRAEHTQQGHTSQTDLGQEADPYKILGLHRDATKEEIKKAYQALAAKYHPDKVQHLGEEFQKLAHEKFVVIQKAYDTLMQ